MSEQTLVIIKPDGVKRGLIGRIISMYEDKQLNIKDMRFLTATEDLLAKHYEEHQGKDFYPRLISFMTSGPCLVMVLEGDNAVSLVRKINGATNFLDADCGSIRGKFANHTTHNLVHGSDSTQSAVREIKIWFS